VCSATKRIPLILQEFIAHKHAADKGDRVS